MKKKIRDMGDNSQKNIDEIDETDEIAREIRRIKITMRPEKQKESKTTRIFLVIG